MKYHIYDLDDLSFPYIKFLLIDTRVIILSKAKFVIILVTINYKQ